MVPAVEVTLDRPDDAWELRLDTATSRTYLFNTSQAAPG